ncbi:MAG: response regulator [Pseudomonadota bacterium]
MGEGILKGRRLLAVDDEPDILAVIGDELENYGVNLDTAQTYEGGIQLLSSYTYDLVILDIMGVRGFELLTFAVTKNLPVVMLTAHALSPEALKKSIELGARAYVPKDEIDQIVPFLEDVLALSYETAWKSLFQKLGGMFGKHFGPNWRKTEKAFRDEFEKKLQLEKSTIIRS